MPSPKKLRKQVRALTQHVATLDMLVRSHERALQVVLNHLVHQTSGADERTASILKHLDDLERGE